MKIDVVYEPERCFVVASPDTPLADISFSVESAICHFIGRKVARFECRRSRSDNGECVLEFNALKKPGPMAISKVMNLAAAVREGLFPKMILDSDDFFNEPGFGESSMILDGTHRHASKANPNTITSIIEAEPEPAVPIALISYGLSDMFTGLFALGVNYLKWQGSLKKTQLYIRHNLSENQLHRYLKSSQDYDVASLASTLK